MYVPNIDTAESVKAVVMKHIEVLKDMLLRNEKAEAGVQKESVKLLGSLAKLLLPSGPAYEVVTKQSRNHLIKYDANLVEGTQTVAHVSGETDELLLCNGVPVWFIEDKSLAPRIVDFEPGDHAQTLAEILGFSNNYEAAVGKRPARFSGLLHNGRTWVFMYCTQGRYRSYAPITVFDDVGEIDLLCVDRVVDHIICTFIHISCLVETILQVVKQEQSGMVAEVDEDEGGAESGAYTSSRTPRGTGSESRKGNRGVGGGKSVGPGKHTKTKSRGLGHQLVSVLSRYNLERRDSAQEPNLWL